MRPCDQCGTPIENKELVCAACELFNREKGIKAKPRVSISPFDPATQKPVPLDQSINSMAIAFAICCMICFGLLGFQLNGWLGFSIGTVAGLLAGALFPAMYR